MDNFIKQFFKKQDDLVSKRLHYLFFDRSNLLEKRYFPLQDVELLAQTAFHVCKIGYEVELFASVSNAYLKLRLNDSHTIQVKMHRGANEEPFIVVQFGPFDPEYDVNVIRPIFDQTELLRDFPRFGGMAYYHRLNGTEQEMITFISSVIVLLYNFFNNKTISCDCYPTRKRDSFTSWLRNRQK